MPFPPASGEPGTVCCSYFCCNGQKALEDGTYPIGKAVLDSQIEILDENMKPVPAGKAGEICISGGGVSGGYLDKRKNKMFVTGADGKPLYRSGDLGQLLPDGNLAFLHRKDSQVMILDHIPLTPNGKPDMNSLPVVLKEGAC